MDLATLQTSLPPLLGTLMGIPCQHRTQPAKVINGPSAVVDLLSPSTIGVDDREIVNVDAGGTPVTNPALVTGVRETVHGLRELTLQVTVWSPSQKLGESARQYIERLRTRLRWTSTIDALRAIGLAVVAVDMVVQLDPTEDGRMRSQASLDIRVGYGVSEIDAAIPFIEQARVASQFFRDVAGVPLPATMQIDTNRGFSSGFSEGFH